MKNRLYEKAKKYIIVVIVGVVYLWVVRFLGGGIPCPIKLATGFKCPSCGITRMIVALTEFDLKCAFTYNPFFFFALPIVAIALIYSDVDYIVRGKVKNKIIDVVILCVCAGALVFGVLRNI